MGRMCLLLIVFLTICIVNTKHNSSNISNNASQKGNSIDNKSDSTNLENNTINTTDNDGSSVITTNEENCPKTYSINDFIGYYGFL